MAFAETETASSRLEFSGFGTLGVVRTDSDHVEFIRDQSHPAGARTSFTARQDSLIGVQADFRASPALEFVAQGVSRYGPNGDYLPELTWAFAKFAATPHLSVRGGRLGMEFYMLADSRLVDYSSLTVRPPVDFFGTLPFQFIDGADLTFTAPVGAHLLKARVFAGVADERVPIGQAFIDLRGNPLSGGFLDYHAGDWQWRLTYAQMRFKQELPAPITGVREGLLQAGVAGFPTATAAAEQFGVANKTARYYSLGTVYDRGPLQVQGALSRVDYESYAYQDTYAGYVIAGYRIAQVVPFFGYSWAHSRPRSLSTGLPEPAFADLNAGLASALARVHLDQRTYSLGARWDFRQDMALKAQLDVIRGAKDSVYIYPVVDSGFTGNLKVFSLALDFVF